MPDIIKLSVVKQQRQLTVEQAWQRYVDASEKAKSTLSLEDGIAAGKAFSEFVRLFDRKAS